jgi:hypothetical protein
VPHCIQARRQEFPEGGYKDSQRESHTSRSEVLLRSGVYNGAQDTERTQKN